MGKHIHIVTIIRQRRPDSMKRIKLDIGEASQPFHPKWEYCLLVCDSVLDDEPLDNTKKKYDDMTIYGWSIKCEHGLFTVDIEDDETSSPRKLSAVKERIEQDLEAASLKIPSRALHLLRNSTTIWINKSQQYGPKCAPVMGKGAC